MKRLALLLLTGLLLTGCGQAEAVTLPEVTRSDAVYASGTYEGTGNGFSGPVTVSVTVEDGAVAAITVTDHNDGHIGNKAYERLIPQMIAANSHRVDAISGATGTSTGLKEAVRNALIQAE